MRLTRRPRTFVWSLCAVILIFVVTMYMQVIQVARRAYYYFNPEKDIFCYWSKSGDTLPEISSVQPEYGSIFFHETSCSSYLKGKISLGARQACAIESAAKTNPNKSVYVLFASPNNFNFSQEYISTSDNILQQLFTYSNIKFYHVNVEKYMRNTPLENLWKNLKYSKFVQSHASDILRYLTLWKYGGIYLDLDVIVLKSFDNFPTNFAGIESVNNVAAGVVGLDSNAFGKKLSTLCIDDLKNNFDGSNWGSNGPGVISRLSRKLCHQSTFEKIPKNCDGFKVFDKHVFYPVRWQEWEKYFNKENLEEIKNITKNSQVIHVWNNLSVDRKIQINSDAPYLFFAKKYCPKVISQCREFF